MKVTAHHRVGVYQPVGARERDGQAVEERDFPSSPDREIAHEVLK